MNRPPYYYIVTVLLLTTQPAAAQSDDTRRRLSADSLKNNFEEWLRNEPLRSAPRDSQAVAPLPPTLPVVAPRDLVPKQPQVSINIMTPAFRTEMQLAYQSGQLERMRKEQQGGAMMIGVNPLSILGYVLSKVLPHRKSKKEREREKLKLVLDNY